MNIPQSQARWPPLRDAGHNWAIVLAAGEGARLRALTTMSSGLAVPKQFCSLGRGPSLLDQALSRAKAVAPPERTCVVLAEHHRRWWEVLPLDIPLRNLVVEPCNRGTAIGILLPLLQILHRDPDSIVLVLPSDHYLSNEAVLASSLRSAMTHPEIVSDHIILLGITPDEADPELGYIVPEIADHCAVRTVDEFVEKPSIETARALIARGSVWNSLIFAAQGRSLLRAFEVQCSDVVAELREVVTSPCDPFTRSAWLASLHERLPTLDFSRDILQRSSSLLRVLTVPSCGWSDLGTPRRVGAVMDQRRAEPPAALAMTAILDIAARHQQRAAMH
jgi:mannose-1-phosphate guanylyltransferase